MITEEIWRNGEGGIDRLIRFMIKQKVSARKHRLFAVSYGRFLWPDMMNDRARRWIEIGECLADGQAFPEDLAVERAVDVTTLQSYQPIQHPHQQGQFALACAIASYAIMTDEELLRHEPAKYYYASLRGANVEYQDLLEYRIDLMEWEHLGRITVVHNYDQILRLVHENFGNPFQQIALDQKWLTADVVDLVRSIYDSRSFDQMPCLSDALLDAGCNESSIIEHCRSEEPHLRGCWVLDLLLGHQIPSTPPPPPLPPQSRPSGNVFTPEDFYYPPAESRRISASSTTLQEEAKSLEEEPWIGYLLLFVLSVTAIGIGSALLFPSRQIGSDSTSHGQIDKVKLLKYPLHRKQSP